jgi:hypothetical protein
MLFPKNSTAPNSYFDELYHSIYKIDGSENVEAIYAYPIMKSLRDFVLLSINDDDDPIKDMISEMFEHYFNCDGDYIIMPEEDRESIEEMESISSKFGINIDEIYDYVKFNKLIRQLINNN